MINIADIILYSVEDIESILGISKRAQARLRNLGILPCRKMGAIYYYTEEDISGFIANSEYDYTKVGKNYKTCKDKANKQADISKICDEINASEMTKQAEQLPLISVDKSDEISEQEDDGISKDYTNENNCNNYSLNKTSFSKHPNNDIQNLSPADNEVRHLDDKGSSNNGYVGKNEKAEIGVVVPIGDLNEINRGAYNSDKNSESIDKNSTLNIAVDTSYAKSMAITNEDT
ncbi:MAG: helix-turn-helix domain-containing protein [Campylobacter sp.]|nr:helix-turn-helix domain-containing protein [Campylobacter sp.]